MTISRGGKVWKHMGDLRTNVVNGPFGVGVWKNSSRVGGIVLNSSVMRLGIGQELGFDRMHGVEIRPLKKIYLGLFSIASCREVSMVDFFSLLMSAHIGISSIISVVGWEESASGLRHFTPQIILSCPTPAGYTVLSLEMYLEE